MKASELLRRELISLLRGDTLRESLHNDAGIADAALEFAETEGVVALAADAFSTRAIASEWRAPFSGRSRVLAAIDLLRETELRALVEQLHSAGVEALLMKGAHLAYSAYARSDLRPRLDTDILVKASMRRDAESVLASAGYRRAEAQQDGNLLMYQSTFIKASAGVRHVVDLHWRVLNPQVFADVLDTEAMSANAEPLRRLSPAARGLGSVDALLLAAVHRVAHHRHLRPLIWTFDIHLLASGFQARQWRELVERVKAGGAGAVVHQSLSEAQRCFATPVPHFVLEETAGCSEGGMAPYLHASRHAEVVLGELRALPDWESRWRLAMQFAFPARDYMRNVYARGSRMPLSWLYATRIVRGGGRWLRRSS